MKITEQNGDCKFMYYMEIIWRDAILCLLKQHLSCGKYPALWEEMVFTCKSEIYFLTETKVRALAEIS